MPHPPGHTPRTHTEPHRAAAPPEADRPRRLSQSDPEPNTSIDRRLIWLVVIVVLIVVGIAAMHAAGAH